MEQVDYRKDGSVAIITLNRPQKLNALSPAMARSLAQAWIDFQSDEEARVAILTGTGRAFCAGIDVRDRQERAKAGVPGTALFAHDLPDLYLRPHEWGLTGVTKPVIAAINGLATGIGFHLLIAADLRVAAEEATFGLAEVGVGLVGAEGRVAAQRLPLAVTMEMALTGDFITAQRAYEIGLVNRVVPGPQLLEEALALAQRLQRHAPKALSYNKLAVLKAARPPNEPAELLTQVFNKELFASEDHREALAAFVEKRSPRFTGR
ncbi:MAG: enoyl-CoA hydratase/isomerase family protein [Chloroflexi bacterium]|nr:enoyl-CoA hydratase/isomerase family protein [Chloroflexota bacterium]